MKVRFLGVSNSDDCELVFVDEKGNEYSLFTDERSKGVLGLNPDFWDSFYFCENVFVEYSERDSKKIVSKIKSYKK